MMRRAKLLKLLTAASGLSILAGLLFFSPTVLASSPWMSGQISFHNTDRIPPQLPQRPPVNPVKVISPRFPNGQVIERPYIYPRESYEHLVDWNGQYIRIGKDQTFRALNSGSIGGFVVANTNMILTSLDVGLYQKHLSLHNSLPDLIFPTSWNSWGEIIEYSVKADYDKGARLLPYGDNSARDHLIGNQFKISKDGHYLLAYVDSAVFVKINLKTLDSKIVALKRQNFSSSVGLPAVSDDLRYLYFKDNNGGELIDSFGCGDELSVFEALGSDYEQLQNPCRERNFENEFQDHYGASMWNVDNFIFSDDGNSISFDAMIPGGEIRAVATNSEFVLPVQLEYLALGDSYSSGEGDTEKDKFDKKYYRKHTDVNENKWTIPREKCHISSRSYSYILARGMNLALDEPKDWDTVACSGAQIYDIDGKNSSSYQGQGKGGGEGGKPRLEDYDVDTLKINALNEFIPGRQKQIEFVKKYKPKVITLTIGGNDLGFGDKLNACASRPTTCSIADEQRSMLGRQIEDQYDRLKSLYEEMYAASDHSAKIFILGYPQFINDDESAKCGANVALVNSAERKMIHESIGFLNQVIKKAAAAAGVYYVDIEDSLDGHKLCDNGTQYVTGITNIFGVNGNERQESFHPNAKGNFEMAMSVWDHTKRVSLLDYIVCADVAKRNCPDATATKESIKIPEFFGSIDSETKTVYANDLSSGQATKHDWFTIKLPSYSLAPNSQIRASLHSDPIDLGSFTVSTDGSLELIVRIPTQTPVGLHTLKIVGLTFSSEPVNYEQVVLIKGSNPNDIDENLEQDSAQSCLFIPESNADKDNDGIDDACDSEIANPPSTIESSQNDKPSDPDTNITGRENIKAMKTSQNQEDANLEQQHGQSAPATDKFNKADTYESARSINSRFPWLFASMLVLVSMACIIVGVRRVSNFYQQRRK